MKKLSLSFIAFIAFLLSHGQSSELKKLPDVADTAIIFQKLESSPVFAGGASAWKTYLVQNIKMDMIIKKAVPKKAKHWEQIAYVRFMVDRDGSITNVDVTNNVHAEVRKEAIRLLTNSPKWTPGVYNGRPIRTYFTQPITFVVDEE